MGSGPAARLAFACFAVAAHAQWVPQGDPDFSFTGQATVFQVPAEARKPGVAYAWNFGDGTDRTPFAEAASVSHTFSRPGRYSVVVAARDSLGTTVHARLQPVVNPPTPEPPSHSSTLLLDSARGKVWSVNPDNNSAACLDARAIASWPSMPADGGSGAFLLEAPVGAGPRTIAQAGDGTVWVTAQDEGALYVLDPGTGRTLDVVRLPYASRPYGIAFGGDGGTAYVTLEARGELLAVDAATRRIRSTLPVGPSPRGLAVSGDGSRALIARFLSPQERGEAVLADLRTMRVAANIPLEAQAGDDGEGHGRGVPNYLQGVAISPDGLGAWIAGKKDNTARGLARDGLAPNFQNTVRTIAMRIDLRTAAESRDHRIDFDNSDLANAAAFDPLGRWLFVSLQGSHQVAVVDPYAHGSVVARIDSTGLAPQGLLVDGPNRLLYVQNMMSRSVSVFDISGLLGGAGPTRPSRRADIRTVERERLDARVAAGKRIFYDSRDTRMSKDNYLSCATCHLDGATDARVWDFTDRGEGLRKTAPLLGRAGMAHGPVHWSANFDEIQDFEHDMRGPFGGSGFLGDAQGTPLGTRKEGRSPDLDALAAYVASLDRVHPSPYRDAKGSMTPDALAGKALFERADVGCAVCHSGPHFTDSRLPGAVKPAAGPVAVFPGARSRYTEQGYLLHDVGTLKASSGMRMGDTLPGLDTPTLKGIWEFPPYLHDGSAPTLMDVLVSGNREDRHGKTSHLSEAERGRLVAYLMQLDETPPDHGTFLSRATRPKEHPRGAGAVRHPGYPGAMVLDPAVGPDRKGMPIRVDGKSLPRHRAPR